MLGNPPWKAYPGMDLRECAPIMMEKRLLPESFVEAATKKMMALLLEIGPTCWSIKEDRKRWTEKRLFDSPWIFSQHKEVRHHACSYKQ
jgi:hypothetical protein